MFEEITKICSFIFLSFYLNASLQVFNSSNEKTELSQPSRCPNKTASQQIRDKTASEKKTILQVRLLSDVVVLDPKEIINIKRNCNPSRN